ncbi:MAG: hypothetical protein U1A78_21565 [Polyangia bacterium]
MFQTAASPPADTAQAIDDLRRAIAAYAPRGGVRRPPLSTGLSGLDAALQGGLPRGKVVEVIGTAGKLSLTLRSLAAATQRGELVALIDGADALDPAAAAALGVELSRLLWIKVKTANQALKAADLLLDAGGFGLVAMYLPDGTPEGAGSSRSQSERRLETRARPLAGAEESGGRGRRGDEPPASVWPRLVQRAERAEAAVLVAAPRPLAGSFAVATLSCEADAALWSDAPGARQRLLGLQAQISVQRSRLGTPGDTERWVLRKEQAPAAALAS